MLEDKHSLLGTNVSNTITISVQNCLGGPFYNVILYLYVLFLDSRNGIAPRTAWLGLSMETEGHLKHVDMGLGGDACGFLGFQVDFSLGRISPFNTSKSHSYGLLLCFVIHGIFCTIPKIGLVG